MSRFGDAEQLKRFLSTCTKGNAAATCAELKISRATFYRTMDWIVTQVTAAQQLGRNSRREPNNDLKSKIAINALAHPLWGCDRHARELSSVRSISAPTVQTILNELGLRTRRDRINGLITKYLAKELHQLSDEQRQAVVEVNPFVADAHLFEDRTQLAFGVAAISVCKASGSNWKLLVLVELGSSFVCGKLVRSRRDHLGNFDTQSAVHSDLQELLDLTKRHKCHIYYHHMTKKYVILPHAFSGERISHQHLDGKCLDSVAAIKRRVEIELIEKPLGAPSSITITDIEKTFLAWAAVWNQAQASRDFPTFGRPPAAVLGLSASEVRSYLKSTLSNNRKANQR